MNKYYWIRMHVVVLCGLLFSSCKDNDETPQPPLVPPAVKISADPSTTYQEMVGFGGALTWYSNRVTSSSKKEDIADLIFTDLGIDILRLKNWYYPDNYPAETSTDEMSYDNAQTMWGVTNSLYTLAKTKSPDVKVLLSSWGPPAGLKSNDSYREGTLKKDENGFMYDAFAQYWEDALDHLPFTPDYISIQNEPTYINAGWTTCQWSASETSSLPGYNIAFDKVYEKLQVRENAPKMIGPESQDVPTYAAFAEVLKDKPGLEMYGYHPYNINSSTSTASIESSLSNINNYKNKPNLLTEFADNLNWFNTALFIQKTLTHANSSGYIYWKLVWETPTSGTENAAMVSINEGGTYTVTPYYHLIKHFAKHINAGDKRIKVSSTNANLIITGFMNPSEDKITLVVVNSGTAAHVQFEVTGKSIASVNGNQSVEGGEYFKALSESAADQSVAIPAKSITTFVLDM